MGSTLCDEMLTAPTFQRAKKEVDFVDLRSNFKLSIILPTQNSKSIGIARGREDDIRRGLQPSIIQVDTIELSTRM